jgi:tetratricopeptide (TPR) repeat protein
MHANDGILEIRDYYENSHAIIVGISKYKMESSLPNAVNDATAIQKVLEQKYSFKTITALLNESATASNISRIFQDVLLDNTKIGPKDRVVIYYSGHGKLRTSIGHNGEIVKRGYIIPYDSELDTFALAFPMKTMVENCQLCPARHTLLILDCCYSGVAATKAATGGDMTRPRRVTAHYLDNITRRRAIQLLAAGEEDEPVADSGIMPGYSAFTGALLSILEPELDPDDDGILTASELGVALRHQISLQDSGFFQNPVYTNIIGHENGDFVFKIFGGNNITNDEVSQEPVVDTDSLLESARNYFSDGLYEKALEIINKALKINQGLYSAYDLRGSVLSALGRYNEAISNFDKSLEIKPDNHRALINKGITLIAIKDIEQARKVFQLVIQLNPSNPSGWYYRGIALRTEYKYKEAINSFEQALRIRPNYLEALNAKESALAKIEEKKKKNDNQTFDKATGECDSLLSKGVYIEANKCYDEIIETDDSLINAWYSKGLALINMRLYYDAIKCFEKVAIKNSHTSSSYYRRAILSYSMGRFNEAVDNIKKVINLDFNDSEAWKFLAHVLHDNLYKYSEAQKCLDQAISINPNQPDVWYNKARTLTKLRNYGEAIECYNKAIQLNPNYAEAWNNKGNLFHRFNQYKDAVESFDKALAINPNDAKIWYNKGNVFLYLKSPKLIDSSVSVTSLYETAVECYNKAIQLNPNYAEAWNNKGLALERLGRKREAKASLAEASKLQTRS